MELIENAVAFTPPLDQSTAITSVLENVNTWLEEFIARGMLVRMLNLEVEVCIWVGGKVTWDTHVMYMWCTCGGLGDVHLVCMGHAFDCHIPELKFYQCTRKCDEYQTSNVAKRFYANPPNWSYNYFINGRQKMLQPTAYAKNRQQMWHEGTESGV